MNWFNLTKRGFVIVLLTMFLAVPIHAASEVFVHFIVVPSKTNDGRDIDKALDDLKQHFAELAGGYTFLGATDGGYFPPAENLKRIRITLLWWRRRKTSPGISRHISQSILTPRTHMSWSGRQPPTIRGIMAYRKGL